MRTNYRNYERQDFSYLLTNNGNEVNNAIADESELDLNEEQDLKLHTLRAEKLADPSNKYIYSHDINIYHDRECPVAAKIPDSDFEMCKVFSDEYTWCPSCYRAAVIRYGMNNDNKLFDRYRDFFKKAKASTPVLHKLIVESGAKIWIISSTVMEFFVNEDKWRISLTSGQIKLYHNDYRVTSNGKRVMQKTFHLQVDGSLPFSACVDLMTRYSWENHLKKKAGTIENNKIKAQRLKTQYEVKNNGFIINFALAKNHYIFYDKYIYLDTDEYVADKYLMKYNVNVKFLKEYIIPDTKYRFIICKVPKKQKNIFVSAMAKIPRFMLSQGNFEYNDFCKILK